ncbi:MAG: sulfite exporter TauE/SafE family protein [Acidobacteria bacterium]|nr:sulfite exporter TauE/SafE family protein [Acidobacteriota bacterium]
MNGVPYDLLGFVTLGLLGGFGHCVGMCSPFVLFVSRRYHPVVRGGDPGGTAGGSRRLAPLAPQGWYHAGRIVTYAALGALAGTVGGAANLAGNLVGLQRGAMLVAGAVLAAWGLVALSDLASFDAGGRFFGRVAGRLKGRVPEHPFATGLFLGLLPCGFLYSAVVAAVSRGGAAQGASALALFGLGTAPALLGVSVADELLARRRAFFNRLAQLFILVMGGWFLWRGLFGG